MPTSRSSTAHFVCSTVCKSFFCGFATQKVSTKNNVQTAAELGVDTRCLLQIDRALAISLADCPALCEGSKAVPIAFMASTDSARMDTGRSESYRFSS